MKPTRENLIKNLTTMLEKGHVTAKCPGANPEDDFYYNFSSSGAWCKLCHDFMGCKCIGNRHIPCPCYYYGRLNIENILIAKLKEVS